jgi:hypothetical protein
MTAYLKVGETDDNRDAVDRDLRDVAGEDDYWRENFGDRPYVDGGSYEDFGPAYAYGVSSYHAHSGHGHGFDEVEHAIGRDWDKVKGTSSLTWERARHAVRDAWDRLTG